MAHNTRRLTDAGTVIGTSADLADAFRDIDETTTKALNGADGGTFTIGGSGIEIDGPVIIACPLDMNGAETIVTSGGPLVHGGNDYIRLGAGHSGLGRISHQWLWPPVTNSFQMVLQDMDTGEFRVRLPGQRFASRLRVHDGSEILQVKVWWKTNYAHAAIPARVPRFRVIRVNTSGEAEALQAPSGLFSDGWIPLPDDYSSVVNYENGGAPQASATYTCDQNNVVDVSAYDYMVEVIEESGSDAFDDFDANGFFFAEVTSSVADMRPQ